MDNPKLTEPNKLSIFELECLAYSWGWDEEKFLNSSPKYFFQVWKGKMSELDKAQRAEWERLRVLGAWIFNAQGSKITPMRLMPLPWDEVVDTKDKWYNKHKEYIDLWNKLG